jgi:hypothetical protein
MGAGVLWAAFPVFGVCETIMNQTASGCFFLIITKSGFLLFVVKQETVPGKTGRVVFPGRSGVCDHSDWEPDHDE